MYNLKHLLKIKWCHSKCHNIVESNITTMSVLLFAWPSILWRSTIFHVFSHFMNLSRLGLKTFYFLWENKTKLKLTRLWNSNVEVQTGLIETSGTEVSKGSCDWHSKLNIEHYIAFIFYISVGYFVLDSNFFNGHTFLCFVEEWCRCSLLAKRCGTVVANRANHSGEYGIQPSEE